MKVDRAKRLQGLERENPSSVGVIHSNLGQAELDGACMATTNSAAMSAPAHFAPTPDSDSLLPAAL